MENIIELLEHIKNDNFEGMLKYIPEGIIHRASKYNTPESFELEGSYEEDARYGWPARSKMIEVCLEYCITGLRSQLTAPPRPPVPKFRDEWGKSDWRDTGEMGG